MKIKKPQHGSGVVTEVTFSCGHDLKLWFESEESAKERIEEFEEIPCVLCRIRHPHIRGINNT